jgi:hypothetical protein
MIMTIITAAETAREIARLALRDMMSPSLDFYQVVYNFTSVNSFCLDVYLNHLCAHNHLTLDIIMASCNLW